MVDEKEASAAAAADMDTPLAFTSSAGGDIGSSTESAGELVLGSVADDDSTVLPSKQLFLLSHVPSLLSELLELTAAP